MTKRALYAFVFLLSASLSSLVWLSCSIEQPSVGEGDEDTKFEHAAFTDDNECTACHEDDRPTPEHGKGTDCGVCHEANDERIAFLPKEGITSSGETKTDTTSDTGGETATDTSSENDPSKVHEHPAGLTSCVACHEKDRAPPPHVESGDCAACHEPNNVGGPWKPK